MFSGLGVFRRFRDVFQRLGIVDKRTARACVRAEHLMEYFGLKEIDIKNE